MTAPTHPDGRLRAGDFVEVRSMNEILETLDEQSRLEALPFMPEMVKFVGRRFRVSARADRTCDRVTRTGIRTMTNAVHLEGVRCDGGFHDGCDAACLIYWKEAWLKPVSSPGTVPDASGVSDADTSEDLPGMDRLRAATKQPAKPGDAEPIYSCQATEGLKYTSACPAGYKHSYLDDVRCGNVSWREALRTFVIERFNAFQQRRGGTQYPPLVGVSRTTPIETLDVQPGELVQVRTREEISRTLDVEGRNRGLSFDREMLMYCGGTFPVLKRVRRIIDEPTGKMVAMKRDCVILDGVICTSKYHGLCQRAIYPFWREIWLRRAAGSKVGRQGNGEGSFVAFVLKSALLMVTRRLGFGAESRA
jgi:hypothetical protein